MQSAFVVLTALAFISPVAVCDDNQEGKEPGKPDSVTKADCHLHLVDFLQNGEYWSIRENRFIPPYAGSTIPHGMRHQRIEGVLKRMDAANVSHAMISGMPFVKKWSFDNTIRPTYYLDSDSQVVRARDTDYTVALAVEDFRSEDQDAEKRLQRLFPFICGFDGTDMGAVDMIVKRIKEFSNLWEGIGEVMSRHDDLTNLTTGERPTANHPALHRICNFAGAWDLPVSIHHNIAPVSTDGSARRPLYLPELLELFDEHPRTTFIWCHAGISRRVVVDDLPQILEKVLAEKGRRKQLLIDLSWVVYEDYIYDESRGIDNRKQWAELINKHSENFIIGSDKVANFSGYSKEMGKFATLFEALEEKGGDSLVQKVARDNFVNRMMSLRKRRGGGVTLPENYRYPATNYTRREGKWTVKSPRSDVRKER